jgi:MFS family permease
LAVTHDRAAPRGLIGFFGLHKNLIVILSVVFFLELGEKLGERFLPIFIIATGGSALIVGISNGLDNLLGALYSLPGGYLSDRIGYKRSLILFNIVSMIGYLIVILFPSWQAALVGAVLFTSWSSVSLPAIMSAISQVLPEKKRTMGVSMHSFIRRFPMALGPVLGGLMISHWGERDGVRLAFAASFAVAFISIFVQQFLLHEDRTQPKPPPIFHPFRILSIMGTDLRRLLISDILIRFCEQIPYAFVVVWCIKVIGVSAFQFGVLTSIEMITAILVYIPVAALVEHHGKKKPFIAITFGFFSVFPVVLLFSHSILALSFAFFVRGLKEFGEPTRKSLILDFAQGEQEATIYGAYYMFRDTIVSLAAIGGGLLWTVSPAVNFWTASAFGFAGLFYFVRFCKE